VIVLSGIGEQHIGVVKETKKNKKGDLKINKESL